MTNRSKITVVSHEGAESIISIVLPKPCALLGADTIVTIKWKWYFVKLLFFLFLYVFR